MPDTYSELVTRQSRQVREYSMPVSEHSGPNREATGLTRATSNIRSRKSDDVGKSDALLDRTGHLQVGLV